MHIMEIMEIMEREVVVMLIVDMTAMTECIRIVLLLLADIFVCITNC